MEELSRRANVSMHHLDGVFYFKVKHVRKELVRRVMLQLISAQRKGENSLTGQARIWAQRRNNGIRGTCGGCGGSRDNVTSSCETCYDRWHRKYRDKKITKREWEAIKLKHFGSQRNLILGILHE